MIGLLAPIKKNNFDLECPSVRVFTTRIIYYVREYFSNLLKLVNGSEWLLLKSGLTIILCFELLYHRLDCSKNEFALLHEISDDKQRKDIANEILLQLFKFDKPILTNSSWIDLFTIIDPDKIDINYLNLAASFENFIMCITRISSVLINYRDFEGKIADYFDNCVSYDRLQGKFK